MVCWAYDAQNVRVVAQSMVFSLFIIMLQSYHFFCNQYGILVQ